MPTADVTTESRRSRTRCDPPSAINTRLTPMPASTSADTASSLRLRATLHTLSIAGGSADSASAPSSPVYGCASSYTTYGAIASTRPSFAISRRTLAPDYSAAPLTVATCSSPHARAASRDATIVVGRLRRVARAWHRRACTGRLVREAHADLGEPAVRLAAEQAAVARYPERAGERFELDGATDRGRHRAGCAVAGKCVHRRERGAEVRGRIEPRAAAVHRPLVIRQEVEIADVARREHAHHL